MTTLHTGQTSYLWPCFVLCTRAALKDDLGCSTVDLMFGAPLHLPGEFFSASNNTLPDATNYINQLCWANQGLRATPTRRPSSRPFSLIPQLFSKCTHVFVWHSTVWKPLQQPHDGPYKVLQCSEKTFMLDIKGGRDTVSIDRLKPVFLNAAPEPTFPLT